MTTLGLIKDKQKYIKSGPKFHSLLQNFFKLILTTAFLLEI